MGKTGDDYCNICYAEGLKQGPCVKLTCGHIFHVDCLHQIIQKRWPGPRIVFGFLDCPDCKQRYDAPNNSLIQNELNEARKIEEEVKKKALERSKFEGLDKDPKLAAEPYHGDL